MKHVMHVIATMLLPHMTRIRNWLIWRDDCVCSIIDPANWDKITAPFTRSQEVVDTLQTRSRRYLDRAGFRHLRIDGKAIIYKSVLALTSLQPVSYRSQMDRSMGRFRFFAKPLPKQYNPQSSLNKYLYAKHQQLNITLESTSTGTSHHTAIIRWPVSLCTAKEMCSQCWES